MKVLIVAPYIFKNEWHEFTRNRTGFGLMVNDIFESVSADADTFLLSLVITDGHGRILRHKWSDVFLCAKPKDWVEGIKLFFSYKQSFKNRCRYFYYGLNIGSIRKAIKNVCPNIVHIHGIGVWQKLIIDICTKESIPYIVTLHGLIGLDNSVRAPIWDKDIERDFLVDADNIGIPVTVISSGMKRRIEENYLHHVAHNITVICNGTRIPNLVHNSNVDIFDIRKKFNVKENEKIVVVIGNITYNKNQVQIVNAFATNKIAKPCKVFLCGRDMTYGEIKKNIEEKRLSNKIYLLGSLTRETISIILDQADLNIVSSKNEGFGLSIIEAYVHGVPTITFADLDAVPDLYDEKAMLTVDSREDELFADAIEAALENKWDKEWIREYGKRFSMEAMSVAYIKEYENNTNI